LDVKSVLIAKPFLLAKKMACGFDIWKLLIAYEQLKKSSCIKPVYLLKANAFTCGRKLVKRGHC
jgi:hypothetical protein